MLNLGNIVKSVQKVSKEIEEYRNSRVLIYNEDCLSRLKKVESDFVDSLVADPPAGISFMNKDWDKDKGGRDEWISWMTEVMKECHRVMKPGAHGLVWAIPRTSHWTATALEEAGFEVKDVVTHLFGSGFPKSLNISKAIDKLKGVDREVVGSVPHTTGIHRNHSLQRSEWDEKDTKQGTLKNDEMKITKPATPEAEQWDGWGSALKPSNEHWILIRKPLSEKSIAENVLKHGAGGINIDGSRIGTSGSALHASKPRSKRTGFIKGFVSGTETEIRNQGRFPSNTVMTHHPECELTVYPDHTTTWECHDDCPVKMLDDQSGILKNGGAVAGKGYEKNGMFSMGNINNAKIDFAGDKGGASRFFYCAKASRSDRGEGNNHPTVKNTKLMEYLVTLVTPKNGRVLDPFMGSGSTGVACARLGYRFFGIEKEKEYFDIADTRIKNVLD